jgi:hypothetical protein
MIFISLEVEIGEVIGEMVGGTRVRIPIKIRWRRLSCEEGCWRNSVRVIGVIKPMEAFGCSMTNSIANLTNGAIGDRWVWEGWIWGSTTSPTSTTSMMRRERALETFDSGRVALGNIDSGNGEVRSRMEVFKALFIGE